MSTEIHDNSPQVFIDLNTRLRGKDDLQNLIAFLQCDSQTGGGPISSYRLVATKHQNTLTVIYESAEAARRVLAKKFFKFKDYFLRSSQAGYKLEAYDMNHNRLIIQCLNSSDGEQTVRNYVTSQYPDNKIQDIRPSNSFRQTYYVTLKNRLPKPYNITQKISIRMRVLNSFATKTIIFKPRKSWQLPEFQMFKNRMKLELHFRMMNTLFIDETDQAMRSFYVQFDTDFELKEFMCNVLNVIHTNNVVYEYCFNFKLKNELIDFL